MKAVISLLKRRREIESEVEEELSFHVELLRQKHLGQGMSAAAAEAAARKRFGDLKQIKSECVAISRRSHPLLLVLRVFLGIIFLAGIFVRVFSAEVDLRRVGTLLMAVSVLGHLLLYARGLTPARFPARSDAMPLSILGDGANEGPDNRLTEGLREGSIASHDEQKRTPLERVISE